MKPRRWLPAPLLFGVILATTRCSTYTPETPDAGGVQGSQPEGAADASSSSSSSSSSASSGATCVPSCATNSCIDNGCGRPCECAKGFQCSASKCAPVGWWTLTAVDAVIPPRRADGSNWDLLAERPSPFVCVTTSGSRFCTSAVPGSLTPKWNFPLVTTDVATLRGPFQFELLDDIHPLDPPSETMMSGAISVKDEKFASGTVDVRANPDTGLVVHLALAPQ